MQMREPSRPISIPRPCAADRHSEGGSNSGYLKVPFARCADGVSRHVTAVPTPSLGPFACLDCEGPLTLRRPRAKRAHFAHRPDSLCTGETALHKYAKELLAEQKTLTLPQLMLQKEGISELVFRAGTYIFDEVRPEFKLETFRPDAIVLYKSAELAVEFLVSHAVDIEKQAKVLARDLSMVEIDLSAIPLGLLSSEDLDHAILHSAPRKWIHHRKYSVAVDRLTDKVAAKRAERGRRLRWHIEKTVQTAFPVGWRDEASVWVNQERLGHLVDLDVGCSHWFSVPRAIWQAQVLSVHLIKPSQRFTPGGTEIMIAGEWPNERNFASKLPGWMIRSDLSDYPPARLQEAGFDQASYGSPHNAIWHYLSKLCGLREGFFWNSGKKAFCVEPNIHGRLYRRFEIRGLAFRIFGAIQHADPEQGYQSWVSSYSFEGATIAEVTEHGGGKYNRFLDKLSAIVAMLPSYSRRIADDLCGLPLEFIRDRNLAAISADHGAKEQKKVEEADARRSVIKRNAIEALEEEAGTWLDKIVEPEGLSMMDFASVSDASLRKAESWLAMETDRRRIAFSEAQRAAALRTKLITETQKAFPDKMRAELFLNSGHPKIGGRRPIEYCSSEGALGVLLPLLPKRR